MPDAANRPGPGSAGVVTLGESMAALSSPAPGPMRNASQLNLSIAGAESNVAIGVRRLGHPAAWIGRVGADEFGALVLERLRAEQVDVSAARPDPAAPTGLLFKEQRTPDVTRVQYYRTGSAGSRLCPEDVAAPAAAALIADAAVLHLTGITPLLSESAAEAVTHAVQRAFDAGVPISLDVNHRTALGSAARLRECLLPLLPRISYLFAGEEELLLLADAGTEAEAVERLRGPELLIKRGERGATAHPAEPAERAGDRDRDRALSGVNSGRGGGRSIGPAVDAPVGLAARAVHCPAVPVRAVDPVGAGDAFVAGYLAGLLDGADLAQRLQLACLTGAFAVSVPSDWSGLPRRDELALLASTPGTTLR